MKKISQQWKIAVGTLLGVVLGYGFAAFVVLQHVYAVPPEERESSSAYSFINPLLACGDEYFPRGQNSDLLTLEQRLNDYIVAEKASGTVRDAAIYFREMAGGFPIVVNADSAFTPGSLLKVPLVMSIYKKSESVPGFLQQEILFEDGDAGADEYFSSEKIQPGKVYTVEELVRATLVHSDNNAALLLTQLIDDTELSGAYSRLGIEKPSFGADYSMPVKVYASFFRILYNSTYLDRAESERLLNYLSEATFTRGLRAGVPRGVQVAHKFGERVTGAGQVQLHDCGIVYQGKQPYLLCVMMRGDSYESLASHIAKVSQLTYEYAASR